MREKVVEGYRNVVERKAFEKAYTRRKTAGWWGEDPMGGDSPLDLLHSVGKLDPRKAANLVEKWLKDREFTPRYAAMGVWDVVMSSGVQLYVDVFKFLEDDIRAAARKGLPRDDDWYGNREVEKWLSYYERGKPSGKLRKHKFVPKGGHAGSVYYISDVNAYPIGDGVEVTVTMTNQFTGDDEDYEETFGTPVDVEDVKWDEYGGKGQKQQSIVFTIEDYEGEEWEMQVDMNSIEGGFKDTRFDDWAQI